MSLFKDIVFGRPNGLRQNIWKMLRSEEDTSPASSYSAPPFEPEQSDMPLEAPKNITPPDGFEVVLHKDALEEEQGKEVIIAGKAIAVFNLGGDFFATSSICPNSGAPLIEGEVEDGIITCPYYGWSYDIRTGDCLTNPDIRLSIYEVRIEGDGVCIRI